MAIKKIYRDKKGFLRIVEAFIAVMLIATALIFLYSKQAPQSSQPEEIHKLERGILDIISNNESARAIILSGNADANETLYNLMIKKLIPSGYAASVKICDLNVICALDHASSYYTKNEIYAEGVSISSTLTKYSPKQVKIFMWQK